VTSRLLARSVAASLIALTVAAVATATPSRSTGTLPTTGILVPGVSLGGLHIGDTQAKVIARWGHGYRIAPKSQVKGTDTVWYYVYGRGEPLGGAVRFNKIGVVTAVFTLGSPPGWKTREGLRVGESVDKAQQLYGTSLIWSVCIGYGAMSMRTNTAVTSIYTTGAAIYGFAITKPGTPVCQ
jgi:hypothetical protein